ncbi:hypothetical protein GIB67_034676 [Kingdonia uniflora]|uniref:Pentatricopeptide repeat-containing protein n=1 Tax=Kingdonia uniflora TaxID=39325 RepID=A0A7J7P0V6_9MAGN|nr:hypothetical protein GIB67_034676 [Kingdonia uniflora]
MIMALNKLATKLRKTSTLIHFFSLTTFRPILHSHPFSHFLPTHKRLLSPSTSLPKPSLSPNQTLFEITPVELQLQKTINPSEPGINGVLEILRKAKTFASQREGIAFLDESGVNPTEGLVCSVIWVLRNDWDLALLGFKWGEKWGCCNSGSGAWDLMVWVLGKHKRFGSAWHLVRMMIGAKVDPQQAMLIMIER